jgi:hypothetical protein
MADDRATMRASSFLALRNRQVAPLIVFAIAVLLFSINLDRPPHPDELHHAIAAKGLLETGRPALAEGEYWRGILHTWMVAGSYKVFGEGLASARLPAVAFAALLAAVLFLWVQREAGVLAAWLAAMLFITSPFTVEIAQFSRFYALQTFAFVLGSAMCYYALHANKIVRSRVLQGVLAIGLLTLATSLQVTTLVGILGIGIWVAGLLARRIFLGPAAGGTERRIAALVVIVLGVIAIVMASSTNVLESAMEQYRKLPLHAADTEGEYWFYYLRLFLFYPTLWTLIGVLAVFAIVRSPRITWLAIAVFGTGFVAMSLAPWKATRYLSFALPFLAIVWGIGLAEMVTRTKSYAPSLRAQLASKLSLPERYSNALAAGIMGGALAIVVLSNPFWLRTAAVIGNFALPGESPATDWRLARESLAPWIAGADIMITTEELGAIYFLGRSDVRLSPSKLAEIAEDQRFEFGIDFRTGRPIISKPESVERLIECFPSGFVVGPIQHWGDPILISEDIQAIIKRHAEPIEVPKRSYLYAWGWKRQYAANQASYCANLMHFSGRK